MTIKATKNLSWDEWLTVWWGKPKWEPTSESPDLYFSGPRRCDRSLLYGFFCMKGFDGHGKPTQPSLIEELEARGYDTTTLEFRVKRKRTP